VTDDHLGPQNLEQFKVCAVLTRAKLPLRVSIPAIQSAALSSEVTRRQNLMVTPPEPCNVSVAPAHGRYIRLQALRRSVEILDINNVQRPPWHDAALASAAING